MLKRSICLLITLLLTGLALSSCSLFQIYRPEVTQGNVITTEKVQQLHIGMSEEQVRAIMGEPILKNIFSIGRLDYVYTYQKGNDPRQEKRVLCVFRGGRLSEIQY